MSTTVLQLAISMIFLYLMLSAASSAIQEIVANFFRWRAKTLEKGIAGLFGSEEFKNQFYNLPLIESLCSPNARGDLTHRPSYIAPATFALAVLDLAARQGMNLSGTVFSPPSVTSPPNPFAKPEDLLRSLLLGADTVEEQRKRIETWFNDSMDRVSGWYKRKAHAVLWIIGILLCIFVNADSISLAKTFWNDPTLRAATVAAATEHVKNPPKEEQKPTTPTNPASTAAAGGTASGQTASSGDTAFKRLNDVRQELTKLDIPLGWCWHGDESGLQKKCFPIFNNPVTFTFAGARGNAEYDYWIVSNFEDGKSTLAGPFLARKAPNPLSDSNYVGISWQAVPGAKSYDILRTDDQKTPNGDCNCAVARGVSGLTALDKSQTRQPYKLAALTESQDAALLDPRMIMSFGSVPDTALWWMWKLVGLALTALAISQGAPFWFDLLQKAVNLRLAGDAPDEKKQKK